MAERNQEKGLKKNKWKKKAKERTPTFGQMKKLTFYWMFF